MLNEGKRLFAYKFKGYWKDVGTSILSGKRTWIFWIPRTAWIWTTVPGRSIQKISPPSPQYISEDADVKNAYITQGCVVEGEVRNSVLFTGAKVGEGAKVYDSVLMPGASVAPGAVLNRVIIADNVKIGNQAVVGSKDSEHIELVSKNVKGGRMIMARALGIISFSENHVWVDGLEDHRSIAAFSFLGRYRVVDFPISNMSNSGIDRFRYISAAAPSLW